MATKPQTKNKQTECEFCKKLIGNSGYNNHVTKCKKEHEQPDKDKKDPIEHVEAELVEDPRKQKKEKEDEADTDGDKIHIIDHTNKNADKSGFEKFFDALGGFIEKNEDLFVGVGAAVAGAMAEKAEQKAAPKKEDNASPYGNW